MDRTISKVNFEPKRQINVPRVAAYARVSTGKDSMLHSLSAQVSYYSDMIQKHPGWLYCGVYADEALTGTKESRKNFQRLLADCRAGKIDLVITKSISRFARNTVTLLATIRELKDLGVDVFFEEQNIHTISSDGELMITILASYAQEESRSASENQKWRIKKCFEAGIPYDPTLLGYRIRDGKYVIEPEEAKTVRRIYEEYLSGKGIQTIANELNRDGIVTRFGMEWHTSGVQRILRNITYTGNLLLQKTFSENHITKRKIMNTGELPKYAVTDSHEAIVDMATFNAVQAEIERRAKKHSHPRNTKEKFPFTGLIVCDKCGKNYRRKIVTTGPVWICSTYNAKGKAACPSKQIPEPTLEAITADVDLTTLREIRAQDGNALLLQYRDGTAETRVWKDRSRAESWTPEMRAMAARKAKERWNRMPSITMIPATKSIHLKQPLGLKPRRKTAGYARVSTDKDEQFTSYEAQIDYYTQYIKSHDDWEFVKVYSDEGISGLSTKKREGFNEMIEAALAGKIDLIVTKSVSRFARNTVDGLTIIRKLKDAGCEVYFEKENIWTFDSKGELLLTIMSSLAQEESRSISENVTWGQRKRFADGKVSMSYKQFLGYEKGPDGLPKVVPEQAKTVRYIYDLFMSGKTVKAIAKQLTAEGVPTPGGKKVWRDATVESILTNEKYKGDARLQKTFTVDFLQKKTKINEGEVPQYYVESSHEAIIAPQLFDRVQEEMARRKILGRTYSGKSIFSSRLICADCGHYLGPKVWNSTTKYRHTVWQCNNKFKSEHKCTTPHLTDATIKAKFLEAFNQLLADREALIADCRSMQTVLTDCSDIDREIKGLQQELDIVEELIRRCVDDNSSTAIDQDEYNARYNSLIERYDKAQERINTLKRKRAERRVKADAIGNMMFRLRELDQPLEYFDERLWLEVIDSVLVHPDGLLTFKLYDGTEVSV